MARRLERGKVTYRIVRDAVPLSFLYDGDYSFGRLPHSNGILRYPSVRAEYRGGFHEGLRNGYGTLSWGENTVSGIWNDDHPDTTDRWKIHHENGDSYFGPISVNERGRPTEEESVQVVRHDPDKPTAFFTLPNPTFHEYAFEDFVRDGEDGEFTSKETVGLGERRREVRVKYRGGFRRGLRHCRLGYWVRVGTNEKYVGGFVQDRFEGQGTRVYSDGGFYVGGWKAGQRAGNGRMYLSNGCVLSGLWNGKNVRRGVLDQATLEDGALSVPSVLVLLSDCERFAERWDKQRSYVPLSMPRGFQDGLPETGRTLRFSRLRRWELLVDHGDFFKGFDFKSLFGEVENEPTNTHVSSLIRKLKANADLRGIVMSFGRLFQVSYPTSSDPRNISSRMIARAIDDAHSFILLIRRRLHQRLGNDPCKKKFQAALTEFVHQVIHETLFCLYKTKYRSQDLLIKGKLSLLNQTPDGFIRDPKYLPSPVQVSVEQEEEEGGEHEEEEGEGEGDTFVVEMIQSPDDAYPDSVELLGQMHLAKSPRAKLKILAELRKSVLAEMGIYRSVWLEEGEDPPMIGADDITPVYAYVFAKARIHNYVSTAQYLTDWSDVDPEERNEQLAAHVLCFFQGFLDKVVVKLDPGLRDMGGSYVPVSLLESRIILQIKKLMSKNQRASIGSAVGFRWVSSVLLAVYRELQVNENIVKIEPGGREEEEEEEGEENKDKDKDKTEFEARVLLDDEELVKLVRSQIATSAQVLSKESIMFEVSLTDDGVLIEFVHVYPAFVYDRLGYAVNQFLAFEVV